MGSDLVRGEVKGEEAAACSDPAEGQSLRAEVVLEHPVVAAGLLEEDRPDRGEGVDAHGKVRGHEGIVGGPYLLRVF